MKFFPSVTATYAKTSAKKNVQLENRIGKELKKLVNNLWKSSPGLGTNQGKTLATTHSYLVTIKGCSSAQAEEVMAERIGYDEDLGFGYTISFKPYEQNDKDSNDFLVTIDGCSKNQADEVAGSRLAVDEDLGFDYSLGYRYGVWEWI